MDQYDQVILGIHIEDDISDTDGQIVQTQMYVIVIWKWFYHVWYDISFNKCPEVILIIMG